MDEKAPKNPYQATLNLPTTGFSIRANAAITEPEILARWERDGLSERATHQNKGKKKFILHDGPPYANGNLHLGHALTYILKDTVCKAKRMQGMHAPLVPGWDCHGLPIELKVTTERGLEKSRDALDRVTFKKYCREFVQHWIAVQRSELKELGKLADYDHAYVTMDPGYEASIVRAFATFVEKGHIERKLKTVPWCGSCQTVLATAEIEYKDRKDPSITVLFPFEQSTAHMVFPFLLEKKPNLTISFAVWTTTPWTLPLNRAVVLNPTAVYSVLQGRTPDEAFIVAKELADKVCAQLGLEKIELAEADAIVFEKTRVQHPFIAGATVPVLHDQMVQVAEGTACLHSAPGCGPDDYVFGVKNGLEIFSPLSSDGKYTKGILPTELEGMPIADGGIWVIKALAANGRLLHKASITHSYPHCWRCHNGLMFRATNQWFCDLQKNNLVQRALAEIEQINFVPERGRARLRSFIGNRAEWCISRQRQWGVPITAVLCDRCPSVLLDASFIRSVADRIAREGIEFWDRMDVPALIHEGLLPATFVCRDCGNADHATFKLERDILDVWFDSGASSYAVLAQDEENLGIPADLYFEGSDQHRGWFQSSLLCGMVLFGHTPTKGIATHGYIVDEQRRKMSKSLGNGIAPDEVIKKYSRDILRLWAASADYEDDLVISEKLLQNVAEIYRKIRNTCRFMVANIHDFDVTRDSVPVSELTQLDQYALARLHALDAVVRAAYNSYNFAGVVQALNNYCVNTLSAVYLDILKDRLYVEAPTSQLRRSAQTVLWYTLDAMTRLMAPVLSFLAEELSDTYQKDKVVSIHLQDFAQVPVVTGLHQQAWNGLEQLRDAVLKGIEIQRAAGIIKHPYEAAVTVTLDVSTPEAQAMQEFIASLALGGSEAVSWFFKEWLIVSRVTIVTGVIDQATTVAWLDVAVGRADGVKCPRCWQWGASAHADGLCPRCEAVL